MKNEKAPGLFSELIHYARRNKRWWLLPMIGLLVLFGVLLVIAEVAPVISPFIYTLF